MSEKRLAPGAITPESGLYEVFGPGGGDKKREITSTKGHPLLPSQKPGETYALKEKA